MPSIVAETTSELELSHGDLTRPLFGGYGVVGDVAAADIVIDTAGMYRSGEYTIPGVTGFEMSLDGVTYGEDGASLTLPGPLTDSPQTIYFRVASAHDPASQLILPQTGIIEHPAAAGTVIAVVVLTGDVTAGLAVSGTVIATAAASLDSVQHLPAAGTVVTTSVASGAVTANLAASGTVVATSVASGAATVTIGAVTNFAASVSSTTISLSWTAVSGADHYVLEWGTDGVTYGNTISPDPTTNSYSHTGRSANTTYYYRIKASADAGGTLLSASYATCYGAVQILFTVAHASGNRCVGASWAIARGGTGTLSAISGDADTTISNLIERDTAGPIYYVDRVFLDFNTAAIPSGATIDQGWLRLTMTSKIENVLTTTGCAICKGSWTNAPAASSDFTAMTLTDLGGPSSAPTVDTPTDYAVTTPNTNLTKNGTTRLALVDRHYDIVNTDPGSSGFDKYEVTTWGAKAHATTDRRPQLKVSYHG